jgi:hypothetical protein
VKNRLVIAGFLGSALIASAQPIPLGGEFRVNTYTTNFQIEPSVATDGTAAFVITWGGSPQASGCCVLAQRFDPSGAPLGPEFLVNTTPDVGTHSRVARNNNGFVIVWNALDGDLQGVFGQRYDSAGQPLGPEFRVNAATAASQDGPEIAMGSNSGNFVVVWTENNSIVGQRFSSSGAPLGAAFRANTYTTSGRSIGRVAMNRFDSFVIVWSGHGAGDNGIFGQRYLPGGAPVDGEFAVNTITTGLQFSPVAAYDALGRFVVAWTTYADDLQGDIHARRFAATGAPSGAEFRVNTSTSGSQKAPDLRVDSSGFVIVWHSTDGDSYGVFGRRFAVEGSPIGQEFRINTYTTGLQTSASIAQLGTERYIVAWRSDLQDGSGTGIYAQRLCFPRGDADGNGSLDVADIFYLINSLFAGGPAPVFDSNVNGDLQTDVGDIFYLINYLFAGGPKPDCP